MTSNQKEGNMITLYHKNCSDGFCAAWIIRKAFGPGGMFIPVQYGEDPPECVKDADVVIVDFSYKRDVLLELAARNRHVTVIDHHKTAEAELCGLCADNLDCIFDMDQCGASLVFRYFDQAGFKIQEPWFLCYVKDYDLWRHVLPFTREVNAALRSYPFDFQVWDHLANNTSADALYLEGAAIQRYRRNIIDQTKKHAREGMMFGYNVWSVCCTVGEIISDVAGELASKVLSDGSMPAFGVCWFPTEDKDVYSLRSRGDFDVSELAKRMGGGGHRNAAGFHFPR